MNVRSKFTIKVHREPHPDSPVTGNLYPGKLYTYTGKANVNEKDWYYFPEIGWCMAISNGVQNFVVVRPDEVSALE